MQILVAGDYVPCNRMAVQISQQKYNEIFSEDLITLIKSSDYALVNLECPIFNSQHHAIKKVGPSLGANSSALDVLKYAGFNGVTMANNHILDYGEEALEYTIEMCKSKGIDYFGVGKNLDESGQVNYVSVCDKILAIINCCEHEFSIASPHSSGANPINPVRQFYAIKEARKNSDYVIVVSHGGYELYNLPSIRMKDLYHYYIDIGADAVINHHQHCFSGYEIYNSKPIFYGLGNFAFDRGVSKDYLWNDGYVVILDFLSDNTISFKTVPYRQYAEEPSILSYKDLNYFNNAITKINSIINDNINLQHHFEVFARTTSASYKLAVEPYDNWVLRSMFVRHWLPSFVTSQKKLRLLNYIRCESHRERLIFSLDEKK